MDLFAGSNGDADIENRFWTKGVGKGEGGISGESSVET